MPFNHLRRPSVQKLIQKVAGTLSPSFASTKDKHRESSFSLRTSQLRLRHKRQESTPSSSSVSPTAGSESESQSPLQAKTVRLASVPSSPTSEQSRKVLTNQAVIMAEGEPDYSSLPLTERWVHKVWKVRKSAYEEAAKLFEATPDEYDPVFRPFNQDPSLWKGAVADANVAAQSDGIAAFCAFLKFGGKDNCTRSRNHVVTPICEKALISTRPATKASAIEALLLLAELDAPGPVIEDILPVLSAKLPKVVAAALNALTTIFHNYGCKIADPKPVLKTLPKAFGHADKNVRAEATNLAAEFYRWLRDAMKPMFWGDLKSTQQADLEAQFEKIKAEGPPKQERLLRSQQEAAARAPVGGAEEEEYDEADDVEEAGEVDVFDLFEPQEILSKVPSNFHDNLASSKWKERKEALEALYALTNVPKIKDGDYGQINHGLAKCMKDANVAVVTQAAQCIEVLAKGLRRSYGRYRSVVMAPIMERLKEKKTTVADALGAALDQVFLATSLSECMEDITTYLVHKNPQVKEGTMKFLIRSLRTTRDVPSKQEIATLVEFAKKLLAESSEGLRSGGAEVLGTIMKIVGERAMNPHLEGLDDIRKNKTKEYFQTAEVKAKDKPKPPPPAARPPPAGPKKIVGGTKKAPAGARKTAPAAAAQRSESPPLIPQPTPKASPAANKLRSGLTGLKAPRGRLAGPGGLASPRRAPAAAAPPPPPSEDEEPMQASPPPPRPRIGLGRGGLAGRSLSKPAAPTAVPLMPTSPTPSSGLAVMERAELEELRAANDRLLRLADETRQERNKMSSEIQELKNQNAQLIEDHTRDVLSIKAKETQLVRARSDAEAAEQTNERLRRELERLKRALSKAEAAGANSDIISPGVGSPTHDDMGIYRDGGNFPGGRATRASFTSNLSEEKENGDPPINYTRNKMMSPDLRYGSGSSGRGSPARGYRSTPIDDGAGSAGSGASAPSGTGGGGGGSNGVESWKRAAEVTSQLKARIEQMKAKQGFNRS